MPEAPCSPSFSWELVIAGAVVYMRTAVWLTLWTAHQRRRWPAWRGYFAQVLVVEIAIQFNVGAVKLISGERHVERLAKIPRL